MAWWVAGPRVAGYTCNGTEQLTGRNNVFLGDRDFFDPDDITFLFYQEGCGNLAFHWEYSIAYNVKNTGAPYVDPPYPGGHNLLQDPRLTDPLSGQAHGMQLASGSPAIDAGDNGTCPTLDYLGAARPLDGDGDGNAVCDMGAYEWGASASPQAKVYLPFLVR